MGKKPASRRVDMTTGVDAKAAVFTMYALHGRPRTHDPICRTQREIVEVLMIGMTACFGPWLRRFVNYHGVY